MRSWRATHNLLAVSANTKETAINTEQTPDTSMLVAMSDVINLEPRRESNAEELTGNEEPDTIYDLGALSVGPFNFEKAQPQHFAFLMAYALGTISTAAAGTGYQHSITPIADDEDESRSLPSFTAAQRFGKTVLKRRFASMFVDSLVATFAADDWVKIRGDIKGTGKVTDNITEESITAARNATSLTLDANAVEGADAAERLQNVQRIRVEMASGVWTEVAYSVVSAATPAVITITAPGDAAIQIEGLSKAAACVVTWTGHGLSSSNEVDIAGITQADWSGLNATHVITKIDADSFSIPVDTSAFAVDYNPATDPGTIVNSTDAIFKALYFPTESGWMTFPARVSETPLRVAETTVTLGGKWSGSAFEGGRDMCAEIRSVEWSFNNNMEITFAPCAGDAYASRAFRPARTQTIKVDREFREYILQQHIDDNDTFGFYILAEGAIYDTPHKYQVEIIFPKVAVLNAPLNVDGKCVAEAGDLVVLEDDTYGSVIAKVKNLQAAYAA
jgi:hypothetical protein